MSGIAELLANLGYEVSGSDARRSDDHRPAGARWACASRVGHDAAQRRRRRRRRRLVGDRRGQPRGRRGARARHVPVIPRAEMLAELMRLRFGIAIAGAHGKTTTTSMVALVLERAGLDPTAVIGGRLSAFGSNARLGRGEYMVAEADESDRSFLKLSPAIAVITNIDREHMESLRHVRAPRRGVRRLRRTGAVLRRRGRLRRRRAGARRCCRRLTRRVITYGFDDGRRRARRSTRSRTAARRAAAVALQRARRRRTATGERRRSQLGVPGRHNLLNALAAVAVGLELGVPFDRIAGGARGVPRRRAALSRCAATARGVTVVDDYGHHPTEIAAVLRAARAGIDRRGRRRVPAAPLHAHARPARRVRAGARRCRRGRADRHLRRRRGADSRRHARGARRGGARRRAAAVHVVPALDDVPGAVAALARAGRPGHHARRRLDRHASATGFSTRCASVPARSRRRTATRRVKVAGAGRQNFRRAQVEAPAKRGGAARWLSWRVARCGRRARRRRATPAIAASTLVLQRVRCCRSARIAVHGNVRLSSGEVEALVDGLRGTNILTARPRRRTGGALLDSPWVADVALRRVLPSTVEVFVSSSGGRSGSPARAASSISMDATARSSTSSARSIASSICRSSTAWCGAAERRAGRRSTRARRARGARSSTRSRRAPDSRSGCRRSTSRDAHDAVVLLDDDRRCCTSATTQFVERLQTYLELAPTLRERVPEIDYVDLAVRRASVRAAARRGRTTAVTGR